MIVVSKTLYKDPNTGITISVNEADVLTVSDPDKVPIYILELKVSRKD